MFIVRGDSSHIYGFCRVRYLSQTIAQMGVGIVAFQPVLLRLILALYLRFLGFRSVQPGQCTCYGRSKPKLRDSDLPFTETLNQINLGLNPCRCCADHWSGFGFHRRASSNVLTTHFLPVISLYMLLMYAVSDFACSAVPARSRNHF